MRATSLTGCLFRVLLGGCATAPEPEVPNTQAAAPEPAQAQAKPTLTQPAGQPPLIDRALFFGDPEISGAQLSPDGQFLSFIKPFNGTRNIWVKKAEEPFDKPGRSPTTRSGPSRAISGAATASTSSTRRTRAATRTTTSTPSIPTRHRRGPAGAPRRANLTEAKGMRALIYAVPKTDPDTMYVGINERDRPGTTSTR